MKRISSSSVASHSVRRRVLAATAVVLVGLFVGYGCKPSETPASKEPAAQEDAKKEKEEMPAGAETPAAAKEDAPKGKPQTAMDVLNRMVEAYRNASSYVDAGSVRLTGKIAGKDIEQTMDFSVAMERPDKIRIQSYLGIAVCNGKNLYGGVQSLPDQVLVKSAPGQLTPETIFSDRFLTNALCNGIAGAPPQVMLLLGKDPLKGILADAETPELGEPNQIEGRDCYLVNVKRSDGTAVFWIDQETFALLRVVLPTDEFRQAIGQDKPVENLSLVEEFTGAAINGKVDLKAFEFPIPEGVEEVDVFLPPTPAQLLSKKSPPFQFTMLDGKPVTSESLKGKVVVLDFWATWCKPCEKSLPNVDVVYQKYKDNDQVAFFAVSVDYPDVSGEEVDKVAKEWKLTIPVLRDTDGSAAIFRFTGIPTMVIIGKDGIIQDCESGGNPKLAEVLPEKIDKLLAGENIYEAPLQEYREQIKRYREAMEKEAATQHEGGEPPAMEEQKLPETKIAPKSEPAALKLSPLWKCDQLKCPGNMLVLQDGKEPPRLLVVDSFKSLVEVGADGKVIATHDVNMDEKAMEVVSNARVFAGKDGKRYVVVFASAQQRFHLFDEQWKQVMSYPADALAKPHSGIADVEFVDFDGKGSPQICVGYWGVVGVQGVSLAGNRLWSERSVSNVVHMAVTSADAQGKRSLICTNHTGSLALLNGEGQRGDNIVVPDRAIQWIVTADLRGDGQLLWCGLSAAKIGEYSVLGISPKGEELWEYPLPPGIQQQPVEPIIAGKVKRDGPGQWLLPGPDGSIHIVAADGKPMDKFNYGAPLQGLATMDIGGQPALIVATATGIEAWKVE